jgi:hypothetical protein
MLYPLVQSERAHTALKVGARAYVPTEAEDPLPG